MMAMSYIFQRCLAIKIGRVNQTKRIVEFAGYINLAGNQQCGE